MQTITDARLLVLEDQPDLLRLLQKSLTEAGYRRVICCQTAAQARAAFETARPDFMILDINLPDGDGFSLFQSFRPSALGRMCPRSFSPPATRTATAFSASVWARTTT